MDEKDKYTKLGIRSAECCFNCFNSARVFLGDLPNYCNIHKEPMADTFVCEEYSQKRKTSGPPLS